MSRYWQIEWPNMSNLSVAFGVSEVDILSPSEMGLLHRLVWHVAAQSVFSQFSDPREDPRIDETRAHIIGRCSRSEWLANRVAVEPFFIIGDDKFWRLKDQSCIRISKEVQRSAVPMNVRATVMHRDQGRCVYCGDQDGPFHYDHLWPVSRGGTNDVHNIVLSCAPCNLSKNDRTLREWMAAR